MTNNPPKILVVDDEDGIRTVSMMILQKGMNLPAENVHAASDAYEAEEMIGANDYDLVVTDGTMPGRHGIELIQVIRANPDIRQPRILGFSGDVGPETAEGMRAAGANGFLRKPASMNQLVAAVMGIMAAAPRPVSNAAVEKPPMGTGSTSAATPEPSN